MATSKIFTASKSKKSFRKIIFSAVLKLFAFVVLTGLISCASTPQNKTAVSLSENQDIFEVLGTEIEPGFSVIDCTSSKKSKAFEEATGYKAPYDKPLNFYLAKINLSNPDLKLSTYYTTPEKWTPGISINSFARKNNTLVALNTNPFQMKNRHNPFTREIPIGLIIDEGKIINKPVEKYSAMLLKKTEGGLKAQIIQNQNLKEYNADYGFGGFYQIIKDGKKIDYKRNRDTRNACGIINKTNEIIILAGKKMTFNDCSDIFLVLGADDAIEFDGGNSTNLVIKKSSKMKEFIPRNVSAILGFGNK